MADKFDPEALAALRRHASGPQFIAKAWAGVILLATGVFILAKKDIDQRRLEELKASGPRYTLRDLANKNRRADSGAAAAGVSNPEGSA